MPSAPFWASGSRTVPARSEPTGCPRGLKAVLRIPGRRDRRFSAGAHTGAVAAAQRLHCDAHTRGASQNSLRELRSLRSDSCDESDHEGTRVFARVPAPAAALLVTPEIAPAENRLPRRHVARDQAPGERRRTPCGGVLEPAKEAGRIPAKACAPLGQRASGAPRSAAGPACSRAETRELRDLTCRSCLNEAKRSEFCGGPGSRASQASRRAAPTAPVKRWTRGAQALASPNAKAPDQRATFTN